MPQREFVQTGTQVLKQGMLGNHAYMIESGRIEVTMKDSDGDVIFLAELGPGSFIGEMAAVFGGQRCASAHAMEDSVLIPITANEIEESSRTSNGLHSFLMRLIVDRMNDTHLKILRKQQDKAVEQRA